MKKEIPQIEFKQSPETSYGFEIIPLHRLFQVYNSGEIPDHSIIEPHRVSFNMILLITKGTGQHYIDFQQYNYQEGSLLFVTKDQIQAFSINENSDGFIILFSEEFIQKSLGFAQLLQYYRLFNYQLYTPILHLNEGQFQEFLEIFHKLEGEFNWPNDFAKEKIISALMTYLLMKSERLTRQQMLLTNKEEHQRLFIDFKNSLFHYYQKNRNAAFYADKLGISYKHLNNICKAIIKKTAKEFIDTFLIIETKRILISSNISTKELTYQMGFDEPTNFVKYFKKHTKQTPAQFRKSYRN